MTRYTLTWPGEGYPGVTGTEAELRAQWSETNLFSISSEPGSEPWTVWDGCFALDQHDALDLAAIRPGEVWVNGNCEARLARLATTHTLTVAGYTATWSATR